MSVWDEEPKFEITEVRAIINGIEVKNGDVFLLIKDGEIIERAQLNSVYIVMAKAPMTSIISDLL